MVGRDRGYGRARIRFVIATDRYATLRKFAPLLIEVLDFQSGRGSAASVKAIEHTARFERDPANVTYRPDAPMPFRKEWRRLVVGDGRPDQPSSL